MEYLKRKLQARYMGQILIDGICIPYNWCKSDWVCERACYT